MEPHVAVWLCACYAGSQVGVTYVTEIVQNTLSWLLLNLYNCLSLCFSDQRTVGIFWHNAAETWIDISSTIADRVGYL